MFENTCRLSFSTVNISKFQTLHMYIIIVNEMKRYLKTECLHVVDIKCKVEKGGVDILVR